MVIEEVPSLFVDHLLLLAFIDPTVDWFEFGKHIVVYAVLIVKVLTDLPSQYTEMAID